MAVYVTILNNEGITIDINPDDVAALYPLVANPVLTVILMAGGATFLSSATPAALKTAFGVSGEIEVKNDSGNPIPVSGTMSLDAPTLAALESITVQNPGGASAVNIQDGGNSITVDGTVSATQGTSPWLSSLDAPTLAALESITVQNPGGASAVNIQDGGNSITVDGTVSATQGTSPWVSSLDAPTLAALESITVQNPGGASAVNIQDGGNSITVDGTVSATQGTSPWVTSDSKVATYGTAVLNLAVAAAASDIFTIVGSATKTVKIIKIGISGIQTTASAVLVSLVKRSTDNTGGTFSTPTKVPFDSTDAAATAVVRAYTVNPAALGTLVGTITVDRVFIPAASSVSEAQGKIYSFGDIFSARPITLRGIAQTLSVHFSGVTVTGGSIDIWVQWTEE